MRYLIVTDIHGNNDALSAVLEEAEREGYDDLLVLGDLVGYGGGPNQVVDEIRERAASHNTVRGNHDKVVARIEDGMNFNEVALAAALWTRTELSEENLRYVRELQRGPTETESGAVICHGTPRDEDEYLLSREQAAEVFAVHDAALTFFGHTHLPMAIESRGSGVAVHVLGGDRQDLTLRPDSCYLFNPGSVGQPRDRDPRAAYAIYDVDASSILWRRTAYPVDVAQLRIQRAGLPPVLAYRLAMGI